MEPIIFVLAGLALLVILGGAVASMMGRGASEVEERLSRYSGTEFDVASIEETSEGGASFVTPIAERLEKAVSRRDFAGAIKSELQRADLKLKVGEYLTLSIISVIGFGLVGGLVFGGPLFAALGAVAGFFAPRIYVRQRASKRRKDFDNMLGDTLNLWVNALRSGYSVMQAMETIAAETPEPMATEFERVVQEVRLGLSLEEALNNLLLRIASPDMDLVVTAVNVQREVGGNLAEVLAIISHTIRERIRIKGEILVLTAQVMISGYIISGLPIALVLFLRLSNPEYIGELFVMEAPWLVPGVVPCGWLVLGTGLMLIFGGFMALRKLADIEV